MVLEDYIWMVKALSEVVRRLKKIEHVKGAGIFGLKNAYISFFCFRVNWGASGGTLKLDINHEESYLLTETDKKRAVSRLTLSLFITQITWIIILKLHFMRNCLLK